MSITNTAASRAEYVKEQFYSLFNEYVGQNVALAGQGRWNQNQHIGDDMAVNLSQLQIQFQFLYYVYATYIFHYLLLAS